MDPSLVSRRALLAGGLGAFAMGALAACSDDGSGGASGAPAAVAYQLSWTHSVQFGGTYLAKDRGLFEAQGLEVDLLPGGPNVAGDASTVSGAALVNISSADGVARSNAEGAGLVLIGAQYQKSPGVILSLGSAPLDDPQAMIGKRIGVAGADTPGLDTFLAVNGIGKDQLTFVPSQYDPAVLTAGQVDGLFCFATDLPIALEVQGVDAHTMLLADHGYTPMSQTYTVLRSTLEDATARGQLVRLLRADFQGWQAYRDDPAAAAELTLDMYPAAGLDLETQRRQADGQLDLMYSDLTDAHGFGWFSDEQVAQNLELMGKLGIPGVDGSLWDRSILEEIYQGGATA